MNDKKIPKNCNRPILTRKKRCVIMRVSNRFDKRLFFVYNKEDKMSYITKADPYLAGNSKVWKNWQSQYDEPRTCKLCEEERHGKIYPFSSETYVPAHMRCRCEIDFC